MVREAPVNLISFSDSRRDVLTRFCPHIVDLHGEDRAKLADARAWARERHGEGVYRGRDTQYRALYNRNARWDCSMGVFYFACSVDAFEFKLRWG